MVDYFQRLQKAEANANAKLNQTMAKRFERLAKEVKKNWSGYQSLEQLPRQKAIALGKILPTILVTDSNVERDIYRDLYSRSATEGVNLAKNLLQEISANRVKDAGVNDFVDFWTADSTGRLADWGKAFARDATAIFELGLSQNWSYNQVNDALLARFGQLQQQSDRIVKTSSVSLLNSVTSAYYQNNGIQLVRWLTNGDDRTCIYCSPRNGNVYYINDITYPLHPKERCVLLPEKRRNLLYDTIDRKSLKQQKAAGLEALRNAGGKPNYGAAPFEKKAGRESAPKPVWQPDKGYSYGEKSKTRRLVDE